MKTLTNISRKQKKLIIGLMSGTSADGIDAALLEVSGAGSAVKFRQLAFLTRRFPAGFKQFLLQNSYAGTARLDDITRLHFLLGEFFADAALMVARKAGMPISSIDLIGSHGQTIHHLPAPKLLFGKMIRSTLQIGCPSVIAKRTGVVTVGDFRAGDIAVGGSGAPLVPYFDYRTLRSRSAGRAALNLGGIGNITVLPKNCSPDEVYAFDTGPGNMIIDSLMQRFFHRPFDRGGSAAMAGRLLPTLLRRMMAHPYFRKRPPKSTGREMFGEEFIARLLRLGRGHRNRDIVTTAAEFTALSVYDQYLRFIRQRTAVQELIVSGGGVHNIYVMNALQRYFGGIAVKTIDSLRIDADAKEAICFALLANETIAGRPANLPGATGARKRTVLGTICLP